MSKVQIVVSIQGGIVQDVYCSAQEAELIVVDWDSEGCAPSDPDVARVIEPTGDERLAFVSKYVAEPLETLAGTDAEAAIQYARKHSFNKFEHEPIVPKPDSA